MRDFFEKMLLAAVLGAIQATILWYAGQAWGTHPLPGAGLPHIFATYGPVGYALALWGFSSLGWLLILIFGPLMLAVL